MTEEITYKEAIDKGEFETAVSIIKNGGDVLKSRFNFKLSDSFDRIIRGEAYEVFDALIEQGHIELDIFEYDSFNYTIFLAITKIKNANEKAVNFVSNLIGQVDNLNDSLGDKTWLSIAFENAAEVAIIETMVDNGCDLNYINNAEQNFLHSIVSTRNLSRNTEKKVAYLQYCIDNGLEIDKKNKGGNTPLLMAVDNNDIESITVLVENGADANCVNTNGNSSFYSAIVEKQSWDACAALSNYASPDFNQETGKTTSMLYDYVKSYHSNKLSETHINFLQFFVDNGANPSKKNINNYGEENTAIDIVIGKSFEFFEHFFKVFDFSDVNQSDDNGNTILHKICATNLNYDERKAKDLYRKAKLVLGLGADVTLTNRNDKTPLMLASDDNLKEKIVALILKHS